ncbi:hypothetical protein B0I35DRAFT_437814 [Stachybotrys elegans]|uniref:Rhodopsin domain-containing protein n=1 Tax=Stachybotrys elegans TaxID=80388 RepID=A0A8K0SL15_9HYPO|nr:hypothetical protein B0I35DRAFT_437814 [Stachybotrys elegans]
MKIVLAYLVGKRCETNYSGRTSCCAAYLGQTRVLLRRPFCTRNIVGAFLLQAGAFFAKASILLLYLELFDVRKAQRNASWTGLVACFMLYGSGISVAIYYETPRAGESWADTLDGRAVIPLTWWQAQSAMTIALDLYILVVPIPVISKLHLSSRKRLQISAVFSLALLGIGAAIASFVQRIQITSSTDQKWISAILYICSLWNSLLPSSSVRPRHFQASHDLILEISIS